MERIIVCGDIHGAHKALLQCLDRSNFDKEEDTLIQLGDVADGWSEVYECVDELLSIKNLISIKGNHDEWFNHFLQTSINPVNWAQGGLGTLKSYCKALDKEWTTMQLNTIVTNLIDTDVPIEHRNFFAKQNLYYIDDENRCFVHGGFNRHIEFKGQLANVYYWDRDMWHAALSHKNINSSFKLFNKFKEVYIGHTTTMCWEKDVPMYGGNNNIINLDTGAGFNGKLTFMDTNTKEIWQSDNVKELYPNEEGR